MDEAGAEESEGELIDETESEEIVAHPIAKALGSFDGDERREIVRHANEKAQRREYQPNDDRSSAGVG